MLFCIIIPFGSSFSVLLIVSLYFYVNLYKEYTSLESRELEELARFGVMTWQPFQLP